MQKWKSATQIADSISFPHFQRNRLNNMFLFLYYNTTNRDYNGELMFYVYFTGSRHNNQGYAYLTSIAALKELEQMWDEMSSMKKGRLKRKLLEKYNKIQ